MAAFIPTQACMFTTFLSVTYALFLYPKGGENMEDKTVDFDNSKMAEEFIADVEKAFEKLSEMGFAEFTQIS